jgi:hypothetical protein
MQDYFKDAPFFLEFTPGVQYQNPYSTRRQDKYDAVALTHLELLKQAKRNGEKTLLLLEDDCVPCDDYVDRWTQIKEFLDANLELWETFNGGQLGIDTVKRVYKFSKHNLMLEATGGSNSHFMYFNVDKVLPKLQKSFGSEERIDIDMFYSMECLNFAAFPFLAKQSAGFSDIQQEEKDVSVLYIIATESMGRKLSQFLI